MASAETRSLCAQAYSWLDKYPDGARLDIAAQRRGYDSMTPKIPAGTLTREAAVGGVPGLWVEAAEAGETVIVLFHGGGFVLGSSRSHGELAARLAVASGAKVFLPDYRLAPEHPFPAALEDGIAVCRGLYDEGVPAERIVLSGDSAGGGLVLSVLMELRDAGERLPAAGVTISAWADLSHSGDSIVDRADLDPVTTLEQAEAMALNYLGDQDRRDPRASPLFGSFRGLPPLLMLVGTSEILYDDTRRCADRAREAGVEVEVMAAPGMVHQWPLLSWLLPAGEDAIIEAARFARARTL